MVWIEYNMDILQAFSDSSDYDVKKISDAPLFLQNHLQYTNKLVKYVENNILNDFHIVFPFSLIDGLVILITTTPSTS